MGSGDDSSNPGFVAGSRRRPGCHGAATYDGPARLVNASVPRVSHDAISLDDGTAMHR
jgi:hypothetical protein